jgi:tetratricopeptide (TPR) repeat protein
MKMGKDSKAKAFTIEAAQKCIDLEPDNPKWYSEIGYVYWWCQQQDLAIAMAEKALTLLPTSPNMTNSQKALVMSNLAYYYAETKRAEFSQKAKELARGAYKLNPEPGVSDTLGYVLLQFSDGVDDLKEARKYLEEALNETEEEYSLYMNKHLEQLEQAEKQITGMSG